MRPAEDRAGGSTTAGGDESRLGPPVLIGPSRVTLVTGNTIDAIAVLRENGRVRVVLEDESELRLDPEKIVSVVAISDIPPAKPKKKSASSQVVRGPHGVFMSAPPAAASKKGQPGNKAASSRSSGGSDVGKGAPPSAPTSARRSAAVEGLEAEAPSDPAQASVTSTPTPEPSAGAQATKGSISGAPSRPSERSAGTNGVVEEDDEAAALAEMLDRAIRSADAESARATESGYSGDEGGAGEGGEGAQSPEGAWLAPEGEGDEDEEDPILLPLPEEFDATRSNPRSGFHYVGPRRASDPVDDPPDFPRPAPPVVSLGASTWKPKSGFAFQSRWAPRLEPATDFPNELSGLSPPSTDLRPSWWGPTPTKWPQSIFPENWVPEDGFAKKKVGETGTGNRNEGGGK